MKISTEGVYLGSSSDQPLDEQVSSDREDRETQHKVLPNMKVTKNGGEWF